VEGDRDGILWETGVRSPERDMLERVVRVSVRVAKLCKVWAGKDAL